MINGLHIYIFVNEIGKIFKLFRRRPNRHHGEPSALPDAKHRRLRQTAFTTLLLPFIAKKQKQNNKGRKTNIRPYAKIDLLRIMLNINFGLPIKIQIVFACCKLKQLARGAIYSPER